MRIGSLFAGIGGFDLAAQWVGWETAWFSEIDPYASAVLKKHWPHVPNLGDITQIGTPPKVDLLCGGFPCQDISNAGQRAGITGERSGLWKEYVRLIQEIRPRWIVAENVAALRSRGLDTVLSDLAQIGYDAEWHCIPASAVGAPHKRDRIWIIAYTHGERWGRYAECYLFPEAGFPPPHWNNFNRLGMAERRPWICKPRPIGMADGFSRSVDEHRLRCLGNAIVPQVAALIFEAIALEDMIGAAA